MSDIINHLFDPSILPRSYIFPGLTDIDWVIQSLPDIHAMNDKRYEIRCLNFARELKFLNYDIIVADSSSCEALLRYCESEPINGAIFIDAPDIYTAGERHGRSFRASLISRNCPKAAFIATSERRRIESQNIIDQIYPGRGYQVRNVILDDIAGSATLRHAIADAILEIFPIGNNQI